MDNSIQGNEKDNIGYQPDIEQNGGVENQKEGGGKMEKGLYNNLDGQQSSTRSFTVLCILAELLGLLAVVLVLVWMGKYAGGFAWTEDPGKEFNFHPVFMILGMIFLYSNAILLYRIRRHERKVILKIGHALIHVAALIFAAVGLKAVFDSHNLVSKPKPNLYSLHSWIGITTVVLFGLQWVIGFISFLFPKINPAMRASFLPIHVFTGMVIFCGAVGAVITGITEKALWSMATTYSTYDSQGLLVNFLGLTVICHAAVVIYIITNNSYKRQPLPEEETIQLTGSD